MYFFIADISGYTSFMIQNKMDYTHGTLVITELMNYLVKQVALPIEISKLEGDALFLYLPEDKAIKNIKNIPEYLGEKILEFFNAFSARVGQMYSTTPCTCGACSNIAQLNLKVVAHYGKAAINKIGSFQELAGVDVILVHRLLKNQIKEKRYLLLTEAVFEKIKLPPGEKLAKGEETDKDLGKIPIYVYYPSQTPPPKRVELKGWEKFITHCKLSIAGFLVKTGLMKTRSFHNLPSK
ncbi:MAG: DUF2652 domain-containing protein [Verrucomicrobia bacterium]|nr:DUF2652 domain-containing protein [Verrucomicrobiota bacterium]